MPRVLYKYRIRCSTENAFVIYWGTSRPTSCPNNNTHVVDIDSTTIVDEVRSQDVVVKNGNSDMFGSTMMLQKTTVMDLKSMFGVSTLRDVVLTTGSGTVTNNVGDGEFVLAVNAPDDVTTLASREHGIYVAGMSCEVGMAVRFPFELQGTQAACWGYFDDDDGFYFKYTSTSWGVCIKRAGIEQMFGSSEFNQDVMDGTGSSGISIDFSAGNIFRISFSWYGYGAVQFAMIGTDIDNSPKVIPMHTFRSMGHTSIRSPVLPLTVSLSYGETNSSPASMFVTGRQFSILGSYTPKRRQNGTYTRDVVVLSGSSASATPLLSVQKKSTFRGCGVIIAEMMVSVTEDAYLEIRVDTELQGDAFEDIPNSESCMQRDRSATTVIGGTVIWCGCVTSSSSSSSFSFRDMSMHVAGRLTVCGSSLTDTSPLCTVNFLHLNWTEEW